MPDSRGLCDEVRHHCAAVAGSARWVSIDEAALDDIEPGPPPALDPECHYLEGSREETARFLLTLGAVNFGSGWFPMLRKRPGWSGYFTIARGLTDRFRARGPWSNQELRRLSERELAQVLGQDAGHELMGLFARALQELGSFMGGRSALGVIGAAQGSAEAFAQQLADGMELFADHGFYKRAQIVPNDLALAGVAEFDDLDRLTIFADNLVPHVLRLDGVLRYQPELSDRIDAEELVAAGSPEESEIRACAVHACERLAPRLGVPPRVLDGWLWNRGQGQRYKSHPRHRTRSVFY